MHPRTRHFNLPLLIVLITSLITGLLVIPARASQADGAKPPGSRQVTIAEISAVTIRARQARYEYHLRHVAHLDHLRHLAWLAAARARALQPAVREPAQQSSYQASVQAATSGGYPGGSFGQCVVARESGGQAQVMNASSHYGLYQFSASTWAAYGGNPADWGHASVAEQNQVFANALARGGQSNWSQYDDCQS